MRRGLAPETSGACPNAAATGRIRQHIIPLIGSRRVKDLVKADVSGVLKDIMAGKTRVSVKTKTLDQLLGSHGILCRPMRFVALAFGTLTFDAILLGSLSLLA